MSRRLGRNIKKAYRIYRELGLQLRNKTPKRRVKANLRDDRKPATAPNETWAMDFVHDQLATGKKISMLTVVDTFSRFSPTIDLQLSCGRRGRRLGTRLRQYRLSKDDPR